MTAKSTTQKKSEFEHAQDAFVEFGTKYIKTWTERELKNFRNEPVVIPIGKHGFLVGPFKISGIHANCWNVTHINNGHVHNFTAKINAIVYCLYEVKHMYMHGDELLKLDNKIGNLDNDIKYYQQTMAKSRDNFKFVNVLNRYIDAKIKRSNYSEILKKTLNSAKYLNFRN